jgi:hypothetical protein
MKRPSDSVADDRAKWPTAIYDRISVQNVMVMVLRAPPLSKAAKPTVADRFMVGDGHRSQVRRLLTTTSSA